MTFSVTKNERLVVQIEDLTHDGSGVAKVEGYPIFIPGALPEEKVEIIVVKTLKKYGFGRLVTVVTPSPYRVEPVCTVFNECGGCQMQHLSYEGQLKQKWQTVRSAMDRIAKLPKVPVHPVKGMQNPWRYRNKSQIPFALQKGAVVKGFYQSRTHEIVETEECVIQSIEADALMNALQRQALHLGLSPYDEARHTGQLRHLVVRKAKKTGEVMVVLITRTAKLANKQAIIDLIKETVPATTSIMHNINNQKTNVIFGKETHTLSGEASIVDEIGGISFDISARSFYQINPEQTEVLYQTALDYAQLTGTERVIDAYCGIGTISLFLAQQAKEVYGVEIVPQAIEDAQANAQANGITNAYFEVGAAEEVIPRWYEEGKNCEVLVVDPPRKGCDEALIQTILTQQPNRVVYVSCNPATLARDLHLLAEGGYQIKEVQPVDMFPQSSHVECVALIELK